MKTKEATEGKKSLFHLFSGQRNQLEQTLMLLRRVSRTRSLFKSLFRRVARTRSSNYRPAFVALLVTTMRCSSSPSSR